MLLLERKRGEAIDLIVIGVDGQEEVIATFKIIEFLPNNNVRIGIEAAKNIHIRRDNMRRRDDGNEVKGRPAEGSGNY